MCTHASLRSPIPAALLLFPMVTASAQALKCCCVTPAPVVLAFATVQNVPRSLRIRLPAISSARHGSSLCFSNLTPCSVASGQMQWRAHTWPAVATGQQCSKRYRSEAEGAPAVFHPVPNSIEENRLNSLSPDFILLDHPNKRQYRQRTQRHTRSERILQRMHLRATEAFTDTDLENGLADRKETLQVDTGREDWQGKEQQGMLLVRRSEHLLQPPKEPLFRLNQTRLPNQQRSLKPQHEHLLQLHEQQKLFQRRSRRGFVKEDARWRRRILALRRNAMRRRTSREIFAECIEKQTKFAVEGSRQLREAREKEELRRLRLVDPLVRPVERRRYTVQWWPNFAREALPRLLTALRHADVLIEVRDARLPWLTQLPLHVNGNAVMKPRVVVLTHADAASEIGNAHWARFFRFLYRLQAAEQLQELCRDAPDSLSSSSSSVCRRDSVVSTSVSASVGNGNPGGAGSVPSREQLKLCPLPQQYPPHRQQAYLHQQHHSSPNTGRQQQVREEPREQQRVLGHQEMQLTPPAPPTTPVIFINAKEDGAGVVRLEKAIRRIWRRWREFNRNSEVFRRQVRLQKRLSASTRKKKEDLKFVTLANTTSRGDSLATVEFVDVAPANPQFTQAQCSRATSIVGTADAAQVPSAATVLAAGDAHSSPSPTAGWPCTSPPSLSSPTMRSDCSGERDATPEQSASSEEQRREEKEVVESMLKDEQRRPTELLRGGLRSRRPLHLLLVGMPNVGKSALCNRLLHAKKARSYNYPGVSKVVTHYRRRGGLFDTNLHRLFDCIDSPGLLPPRDSSSANQGTVITTEDLSSSAATAESAASLLVNSSELLGHSKNEQQVKKKKTLSTRGRYTVSPTAVLGMPKKTSRSSCVTHPLWTDDENIRLLAALNMLPQSCLFTIEEAAVAFLNRALYVWARRPAYVPLATMTSRYRIDPLQAGAAADENYSGCEYLHRLAEVNHHCCTGAASQRLLTDLQKGYLGRLTLEIPPTREQLTAALASLRQKQLKKPGRSSVTAAPRETHKRVKPATLPLRIERIGGENLDASANTDWLLLTQHSHNAEQATSQTSQLSDERLLLRRKAHRHDATGHRGDIESSADNPTVQTRPETDGNIRQTDTTPDHMDVTSGQRFLTEDDSFMSTTAYGAVCAMAEKGGRGCESKAVSGSTSLSNYPPPTLCATDEQTDMPSRENCLKRKEALQPLKAPHGESLATTGNTAPALLHHRNQFLTNKKTIQIAEYKYTQGGSTTNVLQTGRETPLGAELVKRLQPQPNHKGNNVDVKGDPGPGMHYRCSEARTHAGQASPQKNSIHIFVWKTPFSKTSNSATTGGGDVNLVAQQFGPVTTNEDNIRCTSGTSAKLETWETGAFEGW